MKSRPDAFEPEGLEKLLERAERDPVASAELDFLADVAAAVELECVRTTGPVHAPVAEPRLPVRWWILAAAASVLFLLALGTWLAQDRALRRGLQVTARDAPRYVASELRTPDHTDTCFPRAMEPYARADWDAARAALEACLAERTAHGPTRFYLAAVLEQLGELERAEELYRSAAALAEAQDPLLAGHARLRLAQLLVARGYPQAARAELEALSAAGGELAPNARELLESLPGR